MNAKKTWKRIKLVALVGLFTAMLALNVAGWMTFWAGKNVDTDTMWLLGLLVVGGFGVAFLFGRMADNYGVENGFLQLGKLEA